MPRIIYIGMTKLNYTEKEILEMTPRKFFIIYDEFLSLNGLKEEELSIEHFF